MGSAHAARFHESLADELLERCGEVVLQHFRPAPPRPDASVEARPDPAAAAYVR
jgi:hypothetical protein